MQRNIPFNNWSLKKILVTVPNQYDRDRTVILYALLLLTLLKLVIVIPMAYYQGQVFQLFRALVLLVIFVGLLKAVLIHAKYATPAAVVMIWVALSLIWTNIFIYAQDINVVTVQFVCMVILSSFYLLTWRWGMFYSVMSICPILVSIFFGSYAAIGDFPPKRLESPTFEIVVILNFVSIVTAHYLYYKALSNSIIDKEKLNHQLEVAAREANLAASTRADFLSTMSHELRTPLNSVIGMSELLLNMRHTKEQEENLRIVNFSAKNLHMLINDVLDFSKLDSNKLELEQISVDVDSLLNEICTGIKFQAKAKELNLNVDIDESIKGLSFVTDPTRITQIIYNLVGNAIKFTQQGEISLRVRATGIEDDYMSLMFSVKDTGIGIPADKQGVIFEAFTQASASTTRNFGGTGLGLPIVKRLLTLFGSEIYLNSEEGKGSEFYFTLRLKVSPQTDLESGGLIQNESYDLHGLNIMVAEDNPLNSLLIKKVLKNWKNEPVFAENGSEAIEKLRHSNFDVILMDIHMPVLDGYEASRLIRRMSDISKAKTPIIALTASVSAELLYKIEEAGMNGFVSKPFDSKELYLKLASYKPTSMLVPVPEI